MTTNLVAIRKSGENCELYSVCWTLASPTDNACELKCEVYKPFHAYILYKVLYFPNEALLCPVPRVIMSIREVNKSKKKKISYPKYMERDQKCFRF